MLKIFTVAFFGHRYIEKQSEVLELLEELILRLIKEKEYVEFIVGRNGDFDHCASAAIRRVQKRYRNDNSSHLLVLP